MAGESLRGRDGRQLTAENLPKRFQLRQVAGTEDLLQDLRGTAGGTGGTGVGGTTAGRSCGFVSMA